MPSRRQFLAASAGFVAGTALPASAAPPVSGSHISLGFSLYGMKSLTIDEALGTCAETGYKNVELALNAGYPTEPSVFSGAERQRVAAKIKSLGLEISGLMLNMSLSTSDAGHAKNLEELKAAAQLAHDLAPANPPLIETVLGGKPPEWDKIKDRMAEKLRSWAETATAQKIILAIKAHIGSAVNSPERLLWLLAQANSPALRVAYDFSHLQLEGFTLEDSLKALLPHTKFIHVKDSIGEASKFQFVLPGEGSTDYVAYFKLLKQLNYSGPVVVEVSSQVFKKEGYDPIAAAKKSYAALSTALAKAS